MAKMLPEKVLECINDLRIYWPVCFMIPDPIT